MRETLKSLSIFSAMLLLLLLISSGCDVNIPGCGKRSLPFFKKVEPPRPQPLQVEPDPPVTQAPPAAEPVPQAQPAQEVPVEMSISEGEPVAKPKEKPVAVPTATFTATPTATPFEAERIAYTTLEGGKPVLWMMSPEGTDRVRLTQPGTSAWHPLWSPSGKLLAFLSDREGGKINLFVLTKGGTEITQLTHFEDMALADPDGLKPPFSWSPKSDEIAYCYRNQVWKIRLLDGKQQTLASVDASHRVSAVEWAPRRDNKYVAFLAKRGVSFYGLLLVNPRLLDQLTLTESDKPISGISWSTDARTVAYLSGSNMIYTASPERSIPALVLNNANPLLGSLVAFAPIESAQPPLLVLAKKTLEDPAFRVAVVEKYSGGPDDPGGLKYLTEPGPDNAVWSPDGTKIAYTQNGELWVMDASGANKKRIAATGILFPSWSKK